MENISAYLFDSCLAGWQKIWLL